MISLHIFFAGQFFLIYRFQQKKLLRWKFFSIAVADRKKLRYQFTGSSHFTFFKLRTYNSLVMIWVGIFFCPISLISQQNATMFRPKIFTIYHNLVIPSLCF